MAKVAIQNVRKSYGSTDVIHGLNVDINDGEFVVLVGLMTTIQMATPLSHYMLTVFTKRLMLILACLCST